MGIIFTHTYFKQYGILMPRMEEYDKNVYVNIEYGQVSFYLYILIPFQL